jgi:RimJ/RimL family protein N-acetyltransferase
VRELLPRQRAVGAADGARRELHAVRDSLYRSGRWLDSVGYAILADDWRG